jgi:hypothetical protein
MAVWHKGAPKVIASFEDIKQKENPVKICSKLSKVLDCFLIAI